MKSDKERLMPLFHSDTLMYAEHVARYAFAGKFVKNKKVLDCSCGSGYGTRMLANFGIHSAIGVDIDSEIIKYAKTHYLTKNILFQTGDATHLPFPKSSFQVYICFETLEHVEEQEKLVAEAKRVLQKDGLYIISTPNKEMNKIKNPYHTKELSFIEFERLLRGHFSYIVTLQQSNWISSTILPGDIKINQNFTISAKTVTAHAKQKGLYFITLASNKPIPEISVFQSTLFSPLRMNWLIEEVWQNTRFNYKKLGKAVKRFIGL